ncbi:MAG: hypothetical protein AB4062_10365 [Crocosphaera sp.]
MFKEVQEVFDNAQQTEWMEQEHSFRRTLDKWSGLKSIDIVESVRRIGDKTTTYTRYYLNSCTSDAEKLALAVRSH